jgi:hypothetical protein
MQRSTPRLTERILSPVSQQWFQAVALVGFSWDIFLKWVEKLTTNLYLIHININADYKLFHHKSFYHQEISI